MEEIELEQGNGVLVITINRPESRNAMTKAAAEAISAALDELDDRIDLRAAVITGAGGTFCSGMDLARFLAGERPITERRGFAGLVREPPAKPLIAAVEGYAIAGGFEIALACDLIVAAAGARFGLPEVKRGLTANAGGLIRLPTRIPYHVAMELALTGEMIDAGRAYELGLVNHVVEPGSALAHARTLGERIAANGPLAVAASKRVLVESAQWPAAEAFDRQSEIVEPVRTSDDAKEGARAFMEKRPAVWAGR